MPGVLHHHGADDDQGRAREVGVFMWVLTLVFVVYFALHPIESWLGVS
ncbi:hypothetical protein [Streptomyces sp. wa22]|nr:hypothetical protein [Streptomyces sp. wa22]